MKPKYIITAALSLLLATACEEFQPVFTKPQTPEYQDPVIMKANTTIEEVKAMYKANNSKPVTITGNVIIAGKVTTSDRVGNLYKS
ncbi:MAG: DUF5689 domain-containing protein, partial [Candidatus Cryptobacteroides sp.]